jgi:hypothetical protein
VRIPTLAISAWIPEQTVVNGEFRATSLLATMRQRFNLGQPLSARDASARSFADIFTLTSPRAPEDWPQVIPRPVPEMHESLAPLDAPLGLLGKSLLLAVLAFAHGLGKTIPDIKPEDTITGARHRHRPRDPRRHLPRNARLNGRCRPCDSTLPRCAAPAAARCSFRLLAVVCADVHEAPAVDEFHVRRTGLP